MQKYYFIIVIDLILSTIGYTYLYRNFAAARCWPFLAGYAAMAANTVISRMLPFGTPAAIVKLSSWLGNLWIALMYYLLLLSVLHLLLFAAGRIFSLRLPHHAIAAAAVSFIVLFIAWGSWRAFTPVIRTETVTTDKLPAGASHRIVFVTDLHFGEILGRSYADGLAKRIRELNPDLVLISGDLLDEQIAYVERENTLDALDSIKPPMGIYACFGNHDYLDRPALWQQMLEQHNIKILRDADALLPGGIKVTGLNDYSRSKGAEPLQRLSGENGSYYSILLDHQPRRMDAASAAGYDLYLAGHTHTGQLFPNRLVTRRMYKLDYGRADFGGMTAITSDGYGFWGPPVRTEMRPEIVLIELKGAKNTN